MRGRHHLRRDARYEREDPRVQLSDVSLSTESRSLLRPRARKRHVQSIWASERPNQTICNDGYFAPSNTGSVSRSRSDFTMPWVPVLYFRKWAVWRCAS